MSTLNAGEANIIGITGPARSGKDTLADLIVAIDGGSKYAFADPMRAMLRAGFGIDMDTDYWQSRKEEVIPVLGVSPRRMMQTLGTEWGRGLVHPRVWLILAAEYLRKVGLSRVVIPDVRFNNEAEWIRSFGGKIVHLRRRGAIAVAGHASEGGVTILPADMAYENNGTLEDLMTFARTVCHATKTGIPFHTLGA